MEIDPKYSGLPDEEFGDKPKRKRGTNNEAPPSWKDFFVDSGIYLFATAASMMFFFVMLIFQMKSLAEAGYFSRLANGGADQTGEILRVISEMGLPFSIGVSLVIGVLALLGNLFYFGIIHFSATSFLGGDGSFRGLFHKALVPLVVQMVVSSLLFLFAYYFAVEALGEAAVNPNYRGSVNGLPNAIENVTRMLNLVYTLWLAKLIGENYRFGMGRGCGTMIIATIVIVVLVIGGVFLFSNMLNASLSTFSMIMPLG